MKFYFPHKYNGKTTVMPEHGDCTATELIKRELPGLMEACAKWAGVKDTSLEFEVKVANAANWGADAHTWKDTWTADANPAETDTNGEEEQGDDEEELEEDDF